MDVVYNGISHKICSRPPPGNKIFSLTAVIAYLAIEIIFLLFIIQFTHSFHMYIRNEQLSTKIIGKHSSSYYLADNSRNTW